MPSVVSIILFHLLKISPYVFLITIDTPEVGPGSIIAPSTSSTAVSATSSSYPYSTGSPTHASSGGSGSGSNPGAIVGGVVGGLAAICIAVAVIFFRRRHSQAQPAVSPDVIESKVLPLMPDEGTTAPSSMSGSPITRRFYVRAFVSRIALVCPQVPLASYFRSRRTQMIQLRFQGTKLVCTRWTSLLKHRTSDPEAPWSTRRPRCPMLGDITAAPLSDLAV